MDSMNNPREHTNDFTLQSLFNRNIDPQGVSSYQGKCFILKSQRVKQSERMDLFHYPTRIDADIVALCTKGSIRATCNMIEYEIKPDSIFFVRPNSIFQLIDIEDAEFHIIIFDHAFVRELNPNLQKLIPHFADIEAEDYVPIPHSEADNLINLMDITAKAFCYPTDYLYYNEIAHSLCLSMLYGVMSVILRQQNIKPSDARSTPLKERYFKTFVDLLAQYYDKEREVKFYATKMDISPKYLSTVIKNITGQTASEWIDAYVMTSAKNLLKFSDLSIQEIAYRLNFPNQSFFGKYFKAHAGMSPKKYRREE